MWEIRTDFENMYGCILQAATSYLLGNRNLRSLVVGVSGGVDSALTCALAREAVQKVGDVRLIARNLPIETNAPDEVSRAEAVGRAFADDYELRDLGPAYRNLYSEIVTGTNREGEASQGEKLRRGNIKARVRMIYLFDLAHHSEGMVLSTDNYTEYLLGFWTLHGDVGNYGMLQFLWKTEVYGLARWVAARYEGAGQVARAQALRRCIDALPTDGLGISTSDFDQIGVPDYETADLMLLGHLKGDPLPVGHPLMERHNRSSFKRVDPQNIPRDCFVSG